MTDPEELEFVEGERIAAGDPLLVSAIKGRLLAVLGGLATVIIAGTSLWERVSLVMADHSITAAEAVSLLNQAGPLVEANADLLMIITGLASVIGAGWSKWRERLWLALPPIEPAPRADGA